MFNTRLLDGSSVSPVNLSQTFTTYVADKVAQATFDTSKTASVSGKNPSVSIQYLQSRRQRQISYQANSLDDALGVIGGLSSVFWGILGWLLGGYESFKAQMFHIGGLYGSVKKTKGEISNSSDAKEAALKAVATRSYIDMFYFEYKLGLLM